MTCSRRFFSMPAACSSFRTGPGSAPALAKPASTSIPPRSPAPKPPAKERSTSPTIKATNDAGRGWLYFNLIFEHAGVPLASGDRSRAGGAARLPPGDRTSGSWCPRSRARRWRALRAARPEADDRLECEREAARAVRSAGARRARRLPARFARRRGREAGSAVLRDRARAQRRDGARRRFTSAICTTWTSWAPGPRACAACCSTRRDCIRKPTALASSRSRSSPTPSNAGSSTRGSCRQSAISYQLISNQTSADSCQLRIPASAPASG